MNSLMWLDRNCLNEVIIMIMRMITHIAVKIIAHKDIPIGGKQSFAMSFALSKTVQKLHNHVKSM